MITNPFQTQTPEVEPMLDEPVTDETGTDVTTDVAATGVPLSNARRLITVMQEGKDPTPDEPDSARAPVTSRQWTNRKAKAAADTIIANPDADFSSFGFNEIWKHVLRAEGGYANDPNDPGGETNFGISKRSYPGEDIPNLTKERAQEIFKTDFFDSVGGDTLLKINPGLAAHVADMAFNAGPKTAIKLMYDAVGLPRQKQITADLVDKLSNEENLIKSYSVARLKYYSSLGNASTYIKGWTNRVNNLNKALKVKTGLNGAYKAARKLDVDSLVQQVFSLQGTGSASFNDLTDQEIARLKKANEMLSPGYRSSIQPPLDKTSKIGEVFGATYDNKYFLNTSAGLDELTLRSIKEASEANRKVLGDKFDQSLVEKMTFGLYGGVDNLKDWEDEVAKFKQQHPEAKLPFENVKQVYELMHSKAAEIEKRYNSLDTGNWTDSVGGFMNKVGKVVAGYLPGELLGSLSDPTEGALALAPLPGATTIKGIAQGAAAVMAGTGVAQTIVQPKRQEVGLEGGFQQGLENTVAAGAGQAVLGGLVGLATRMWRSGSKETARDIFKATEHLKKVVNSDSPTPELQVLKQVLEQVDDRAKNLSRNPYGDSFEAKQKYELNEKAAMEDLLNGRPVRQFDTSPVAVLDNSDKLYKQLSSMIDGEDIPEEAAAHFKDGIAAWTKFKQSAVAQPTDLPSTLPHLDENGQLLRFNTQQEANDFVRANNMADTQLFAEQAPDGNGYYISRPANLEPFAEASGRFTEDGFKTIVNEQQLIGTQKDIELAAKYPEYVKAKAAGKASLDSPTYMDVDAFDPHHQYLQELQVYGATKIQDLDVRYEATIKQLELLDPKAKLDLGEDAAQEMTLKEFTEEMNEGTSALKEMFTCMTTPFANGTSTTGGT